MRLPIDTGTVKFAAAAPAEPVLDYETRAPKLDENGTPLYAVPLFYVEYLDSTWARTLYR